MNNLFTHSGQTPPLDEEFSETLFRASGTMRVERIISCGHVTPEGDWYDQEQDEWVTVLEGTARLQYVDGTEVTLNRGDHLVLPRHVKHRVSHTSSPCVWLAVFGDIRG